MDNSYRDENWVSKRDVDLGEFLGLVKFPEYVTDGRAGSLGQIIRVNSLFKPEESLEVHLTTVDCRLLQRQLGKENLDGFDLSLTEDHYAFAYRQPGGEILLSRPNGMIVTQRSYINVVLFELGLVRNSSLITSIDLSGTEMKIEYKD
jgi:hypothetical protein